MASRDWTDRPWANGLWTEGLWTHPELSRGYLLPVTGVH